MATKKKLTEEQEKEIKILQASNEMLERTKKEARAKGKDSVKMIEIAQQDVLSQLGKIDSDMALKLSENNTRQQEIVNDYVINTQDNKSVYDAINEINGGTPTLDLNNFKQDIEDVQYDVISLPSNGECYKNKVGKLPVAFLTAYDENFITSPNLYKDGLVIDFLLKNKILKKDFNIDELLSGDADAVILFLRATSYGTEFPITVRDPESGKQIETVVDLSQLKLKDFKLKGDANGYFDFTLPLSKDVIKFRYLTRKDEKNLELVTKLESNVVNASNIRKYVSEFKNIIETDELSTTNEKTELNTAFEKLTNWAKKLSENTSVGYNKIITNRMEMNIVSVNGNSDRKFIHNYINNMRAKDSLELRKYINENEPGVDFTVTINRPESLGGGSFDTFLNWDDTIFLNIA